MNPRLRSALWYGGYGVYTLAVFVIALYAFFPYSRLRRYVARQIDSDGRYDVTIDRVGPSFPLGLEISGITIVSPPEKADEKPGKLVVNRATVNLSLWSLVSSTKTITVKVEALGGKAETVVETTGKKKSIRVSFTGLSMGQLPGLAKAISLPMGGALTGSGKITIPADGMRNAEGKFTLKCKSCTVGDGKTKVKMDLRPEHLKKHYDPVAEQGVTLPTKLRLGVFGGDIEIERGRAMFKRFEAYSPDGEAVLMGTIALREPFVMSTVDAYFKFKFDESLKTKDAKWGPIESFLIRAKRSDSQYGFSIRGRLKDPPRFLPAKFSTVERLYEGRGKDGKDKDSGRKGLKRPEMTPPGMPVRPSKPDLKKPDAVKPDAMKPDVMKDDGMDEPLK
jgi:type II secretion system protein N